ncbi:flagellar motor stator protein MotA, partial [Ruegeria sp. NA]
MIGIVGIVVIFVMVFGGYLAAGGKMTIILKSLPFEMMMIGGAAVGAFLISNDIGGVKHTIKDMGKVFKGPKWKPEDYRDLLCLLFSLIRIARANPVEVEQHIEDPGSSDLFSSYPRIQADKEAVDLICDTMRSAAMNYDDPHQVEEVLEKRMEANFHHALHSSHALQTVADGLPALGIVAAVLGVIKTMGSIDQPPEVLGKLIGGALVGTFLGVFLAY